MAGRSRKRGGWRRSVERVDRAPGYPAMVILGVGLLVPAALVVCGVYTILTGEARVPVSTAAGIHSGTRITGGRAIGFGVGLIGLASIVHSFVFWRSVGGLRRFASYGQVLGFLVVVAGVLVALLG